MPIIDSMHQLLIQVLTIFEAMPHYNKFVTFGAIPKLLMKAFAVRGDGAMLLASKMVCAIFTTIARIFDC